MSVFGTQEGVPVLGINARVGFVMVVLSCPQCGTRVLRRMASCPECGTMNPTPAKRAVSRLPSWLILVASVAAFGFLVFAAEPEVRDDMTFHKGSPR
jgi:rubredoxin